MQKLSGRVQRKTSKLQRAKFTSRCERMANSAAAAERLTTRLMEGPALSATLICNRSSLLVSTGGPHILQVNSSVTIQGVKGPGASWVNDTFTVEEVVSPSYVKLSKAGLPLAPRDVPYSFNGPISIAPFGSVHIYWPIAKVTTGSTPHTLPSFGAVEIAGSNDSRFHGSQAALALDSSGLSFYFRLAFLPGGDVTSPCSAAKINHRFDDVMRSVPAYSAIHLGPGTFETRGTASIYVSDSNDFSQVHVGWILRAGQRLLGSGIDVSVVKLVLPMDEINQTVAIAHHSNPSADYAEVADLTLDVNVDGHVAPYGAFPAPVTCDAVSLGGNFIRVRRVRAIHFCTQAAAEGFVIGVNATDSRPAPVFNVVEECILELPGRNNTHETTLLSNVGNDSRISRFQLFFPSSC